MPGTITSERIAAAVLAHLHGSGPRPRASVPLHEGSRLTVVHVVGGRAVDAIDPEAWTGADIVMVDDWRDEAGRAVLETLRRRHPEVLRLAVIDELAGGSPLPTTIHRAIRRGHVAEDLAAATDGALALRRHVHDPVVRAAVATTERIGGADIRALVACGRHPGIPAKGACIPGAATSVLARHATEVARHAALLAQPDDAAAARTAGFLHLLGLLFEAERQPDRLAAVNRRAHREGRRLVDVERELFGNAHVELAGHLLARWGVDGRVVDAVAHSHEAPSKWEAPFDAVDAVRVARLLALTGRHALSMGPAHREALPIELAGVAQWAQRVPVGV